MENKETITHIICTVMTGRGANNGFMSEEWYQARIPIFLKYTIENLRQQTNTNFIHWICFRKEEKEHPLTKDFLKKLDELKYPYIATFNGQTYFDDRTNTGANNTLQERLKSSLSTLRERLPVTDYIYVTWMDSDEMLKNDEIEAIQKETPGRDKALYYNKGYAFNMKTGQLADWSITSAWSTWTLMFPYDDFFDPEKHTKYLNSWTTHEEIPFLYYVKLRPDNRFMTGVNGFNRSSIWRNIHKGKEYYYNVEKQEIIKNFIKL